MKNFKAWVKVGHRIVETAITARSSADARALLNGQYGAGAVQRLDQVS